MEIIASFKFNNKEWSVTVKKARKYVSVEAKSGSQRMILADGCESMEEAIFCTKTYVQNLGYCGDVSSITLGTIK